MVPNAKTANRSEVIESCNKFIDVGVFHDKESLESTLSKITTLAAKVRTEFTFPIRSTLGKIHV